MGTELGDEANCSELEQQEDSCPLASEEQGLVYTIEFGCLESDTVTEDNSPSAETQLVSRDDPRWL